MLPWRCRSSVLLCDIRSELQLSFRFLAGSLFAIKSIEPECTSSILVSSYGNRLFVSHSVPCSAEDLFFPFECLSHDEPLLRDRYLYSFHAFALACTSLKKELVYLELCFNKHDSLVIVRKRGTHAAPVLMFSCVFL